MQKQQIIDVRGGYNTLDAWLEQIGAKRILLVCGRSLSHMKISRYFANLEKLGCVVRFSDFKPNPDYESVKEGVRCFRKELCDCIIAIGGGSAMDVAKCIKLYSNMNDTEIYLEKPIVPNDVPLVVMPTTAGTGSEATKYAVIYYKGEKQSIVHENCVPSAVIWDPSVLNTLPEYQRKSTMLDALCHAVESFWSINSTDESREYSRQALSLISRNMREYLNNRGAGNEEMLKAAHVAGKAINIAQTTAGHAMCYKLTSLFGIAHGHAAALCVSKIWYYMLENIDKCIDKRGKTYLHSVFYEIAEAMGAKNAIDAADWFGGLLRELNLEFPKERNADLNLLVGSVNLVRLKNNPVMLTSEVIMKQYQSIIKGEISR